MRKTKPPRWVPAPGRYSRGTTLAPCVFKGREVLLVACDHNPAQVDILVREFHPDATDNPAAAYIDGRLGHPRIIAAQTLARMVDGEAVRWSAENRPASPALLAELRELFAWNPPPPAPEQLALFEVAP